MAQFSLTLLSHKIAGTKVKVIKITGSLDAYNIPHAEKIFQSFVEEKVMHLVVNMKRLEYISSGGIGLLVEFSKKLEAKNGSLKLVELPEKIQRVFETLGIASILDIHDTTKKAFLSIQKGK